MKYPREQGEQQSSDELVLEKSQRPRQLNADASTAVVLLILPLQGTGYTLLSRSTAAVPVCDGSIFCELQSAQYNGVVHSQKTPVATTEPTLLPLYSYGYILALPAFYTIIILSWLVTGVGSIKPVPA